MKSDLRHSQLDIGGRQLHVVESGDPVGEPIVLLHGWPQSWREWLAFMDAGRDRYRLIALDLPGIGGSVDATIDGSKHALAAVVDALIEALALDGATLVGHDIGGMVAYAHLREYGRARRIVIVDVVIPGVDPWDDVIHNPHLWHFAFHAIPDLPEQLVHGHQAEYFDFFFDLLAADPARITAAARRDYVEAYRTKTALKAGFDFYRSFAIDAERNAAKGQTSCETPVLLLRGEVSYGHVQTYERGLREAGLNRLTTRVVPGAGHFIPEENPDALWHFVSDFIA